MASAISLDVIKKYEQNEKTELLEICSHYLNDSENSSMIGHQKHTINHVLLEICGLATRGKITVDVAVTALTDIVSLRSDLPSVLVDAFAVLDIETQVLENHSIRDRYLNLLRSSCGKVVPECTIKERLEFETLGDAGIIKLLKNTQTKFIKTKTRLFYKQQKFNLFREESEGYAKLVTELNPDSGNMKRPAYVIEVVKSLIGYFNLDPNRVIDIILESFESRPEFFEFYIHLLRSFSCSSATLSQVLGFKFSFYQQDSTEETPQSLYKITALLLKDGLLSINQLYGILMPDDSRIMEKHKKDLANAHAYVKQVNSLVGDRADGNKPQQQEETNQPEDSNQKLGLCSALIDVCDWQHAEQLMACFPEFYAVSHQHVASKLCKLIHVLTDKLYRLHSFSIQSKRTTKWQLEPWITTIEINTFDELFTKVFPMVYTLGPYMHIDPILMSKIIRLSRHWLYERPSEMTNGSSNYRAILNVLDESLLPSLSLLECNCCMAEELWSLLKLLPYQTRYHLYSRWKTASSIHPPLIKTKADTLKKLKHIMKRLSKENVKPSGRHIGKLSHSNPGYSFDYILSQIQAYDNFITPVVDSLKYLTTLSYDVLAYCVIEALANPVKERMKHDGTSISIWLQSLASLSGAVFKKYPIDISGLLQYVANQLKAQKSLDLLILKEVVQKMAGIEAFEEMTPEQIDAMSGGELLRTEGGYFNQLRNVKKSSQRLKEALLDQDLAIPLYLLISQQKQCILYREQEQSHLKLVGKLYDHCQDTLVQFGSFLAGNLNIDDYIQRVPPVSTLFREYHIEADAAFFLVRPTFNHRINQAFDEMRKQDKSSKNVGSSQQVEKYLEAVKAVIYPVVQAIVAVQSPKRNWDDLSPQFYVTFWSLSMYDLLPPVNSYEREIIKLKAISQGEENKDMNKKKKEKERCDALINKLTDEEKMQHEHCALVLARLKSEKDSWFNSKAAKNETITQFLQLCIFPRCIFTPMDALYCSKFVRLMHHLKTPNFSTLLCYDRIFLDVTYTVASCSENEANRYGLFLCSMLETVMRWHSDKNIFEKECANFPGFMTKFKATAPNQNADPSASDHVDYENYRHVCHKWHFKITKALLKCLESGDFIQIRNALLVLTKISAYFPVVTNLSQALERRIDKVRSDEKDQRPDIFALATGYSGILKNKKSSLIPENEFHMKEANRHHASQSAIQQAVKQEATIKVEKRDSDSGSAHRNESTKVTKSKSTEQPETRTENRLSTSLKSISGTSSSSAEKIPILSSSQSSSKSRSSHKECELNGVESSRAKSQRVKEERSSGDSSSPMRREERTLNSSDKSSVKEEKRDRREEHYEKSSRSSEKDAVDKESHNYRRPNDVVDGEREHKRRRTEGPSSKNEREGRSVEKSKEDEKNGSARDKLSSEKNYKENGNQEKTKTKDTKKPNRKRDYNEESSASEPRRRRAKTEDESEKSRREDKSPVSYSGSGSCSQDSRRTEREDKKHHRSSSVTAVKKRSS